MFRRCSARSRWAVGDRQKTMTEERANPFLKTLSQAAEQSWCIQPYCTTCGARIFRAALRTIGGELGGPLADALVNVNMDELISQYPARTIW